MKNLNNAPITRLEEQVALLEKEIARRERILAGIEGLSWEWRNLHELNRLEAAAHREMLPELRAELVRLRGELRMR